MHRGLALVQQHLSERGFEPHVRWKGSSLIFRGGLVFSKPKRGTDDMLFAQRFRERCVQTQRFSFQFLSRPLLPLQLHSARAYIVKRSHSCSQSSKGLKVSTFDLKQWIWERKGFSSSM